jgi:hypothetical protein
MSINELATKSYKMVGRKESATGKTGESRTFAMLVMQPAESLLASREF